MERGEVPEEAIKRETEEETGITFSTYKQLWVCQSNLGLVESYKYYYLARGPINFGAQHLDPGGEKIRVEYLSYEQFIEHLTQKDTFRDLGDRIVKEYLLPGNEEALKELLFG